VSRVSNALKEPQARKTSMHMLVKILLRHSEFGMMAGRPIFSCRPTHIAKAGRSARAVERHAMFKGDLMLETLPVKTLKIP